MFPSRNSPIPARIRSIPPKNMFTVPVATLRPPEPCQPTTVVVRHMEARREGVEMIVDVLKAHASGITAIEKPNTPTGVGFPNRERRSPDTRVFGFRNKRS